MKNIQLLSEILKRADELLKNDIDVPASTHQMHTRIFNNCFANLLKEGVYAKVLGESGNVEVIVNGLKYVCPEAPLKTILRDDYDEAIERCRNLNESDFEEAASAFDRAFGIERSPIPAFDIDDFILPEITDKEIDVSITLEEDDTDIHKKPAPSFVPHMEKPSILQPQILRSDSIENPEAEDDEDDSSNSFAAKPDTKNNLFKVLSGKDFGHGVQNNEIDEDESVSETPDNSLDNFSFSSFAPKGERTVEEEEPEEKRFSPKRRSEVSKPTHVELEEKPVLEKRGFFHLGRRRRVIESPEENEDYVSPRMRTEESAFKPKIPIIETEEKEIEDTPYNPPGSMIYEPTPAADHTQDSGELFMHRHSVTLEKNFGNEVVGPFRFTFWPINVPSSTNRQFASMLVHIIDDSKKTEQLLICDNDTPELSLSFDKKELKVFGIWENGRFNAHITPQGQTASMYTVKDDVDKKEPEDMTDTFFDQFRLCKKGQPKHFVVPFRNSNHGEENIPIIGYVEIRNVKYVLKRMEGNTIQYKIEGREKVITGHWEDGRFTFAVNSGAPKI